VLQLNYPTDLHRQTQLPCLRRWSNPRHQVLAYCCLGREGRRRARVIARANNAAIQIAPCCRFASGCPVMSRSKCRTEEKKRKKQTKNDHIHSVRTDLQQVNLLRICGKHIPLCFCCLLKRLQTENSSDIHNVPRFRFKNKRRWTVSQNPIDVSQTKHRVDIGEGLSREMHWWEAKRVFGRFKVLAQQLADQRGTKKLQNNKPLNRVKRDQAALTSIILIVIDTMLWVLVSMKNIFNQRLNISSRRTKPRHDLGETRCMRFFKDTEPTLLCNRDKCEKHIR